MIEMINSDDNEYDDDNDDDSSTLYLVWRSNY